MKVGIDALSFYTSYYYLDLSTLAEVRGIDVAKFYDGLGQRKMAVPAPGEDIVTLAANAASQVLPKVDSSDIEMLLFATESGFDYSKAAGIYLHHLLNLPSRCRVIELKQACYSATAGLQMAMTVLAQKPQKKILLIASDIARYGLNTTGESSQGCGAVAMVLSVNPRLLEILPESGFYTKDAMDFWRPTYLQEALVDGRYSCDLYMRLLEETWNQYSSLSGRKYFDHDRFCYHIPVPKLVEKSHRRLAKINGIKELTAEQMEYQVEKTLNYSRELGNCYTAALYLGVASLLETVDDDLTGKNIGLYSYGSGCEAEYFGAMVVENYRQVLLKELHQKILSNRKQLSYQEYEDFYNFALPEDGSEFFVPNYQTGKYRLAAMKQHKRIYEAVL